MSVPPRQPDAIHALDCTCNLCRLERFADWPMTPAAFRCWLALMGLLIVIAAIGYFG